MKKFGLLYANTINIGDDIQALAAKQFLPKVDYYVDRDAIQDFKSENNEKVKVILNAWWSHNKNNWPPPINIEPLLISIHINDDVFKSFVSNEAKEYYKNKKFGARDSYTLNNLKKHGIKNSFLSYCLTLTFPKYTGQRNNQVLYVDAYDNNNQNGLSHGVSYLKNMHPEKRLEIASEKLEMYKRAKKVITSRLHCALPCIAFGTPVVFTKPLLWPSRISGYRKILENKQNTNKIRNKLITICTNFAEN